MATIDKITVNGTTYDIGGADSGGKAGSTNTTSPLFLIGATTQADEVTTQSSINLKVKSNELLVYKNNGSADDSRFDFNGSNLQIQALKTVSGTEVKQTIEFDPTSSVKKISINPNAVANSTNAVEIESTDQATKINQLKLKDTANASAWRRIFVGSSTPSGSVAEGDIWINTSES